MISSYAGIPQPKVKEILTCSMGRKLEDAGHGREPVTEGQTGHDPEPQTEMQ